MSKENILIITDKLSVTISCIGNICIAYSLSKSIQQRCLVLRLSATPLECSSFFLSFFSNVIFAQSKMFKKFMDIAMLVDVHINKAADKK